MSPAELVASLHAEVVAAVRGPVTLALDLGDDGVHRVRTLSPSEPLRR